MEMFLQTGLIRVEWRYLWDVLSEMNFPLQFIALVQGMYTNATAQVRVNGHLTPRFALGRGVRQGCPASPLLYVLSLEPIRLLIDAIVKREEGGKPEWLPDARHPVNLCACRRFGDHCVQRASQSCTV